MYVRLRELGSQLQKKQGDVLSISHSGNLAELMGIERVSFTEGNYPEVSILELPYKDGSFDFVFSDQVFEHIEGDPQQAIDECWRVLRPGGVMVHTTCFTMGYHGPGDFWRYTPEGLAYLCRSGEVIEASGWGHPFVSWFTMVGFVWEPAPQARWHPVNWAATWRRPSYDYVVWVVARKPAI